MIREDYLYYKKEFMKRKSYPCMFSNIELGKEFCELLKADGIKSNVITVGNKAYVCSGKPAVKKVLEMINDEIGRYTKAIKDLEKAKQDIEDM